MYFFGVYLENRDETVTCCEVSIWLYAHRTAGGDRHYWRSCWSSATGCAAGT